jgi:capsular exopolysaccharide synthesis family protein
VTVREPRSPVAEAYRVLRTNLQFALLGKAGTVVVSSPNPGEGKTATAANLAVALAQGGKQVVLVDADLRKPAIHRVFELPNGQGLTSLLVDEALTPDDVLQVVDDVPGLRALTSGPLPPNPAEMLDSARMDDLLATLGQMVDYVVLDTPPLLVVVDAAILARDSDGTLLVFDSGATRVDTARRAIEVLARVGVRPLGSVINRLDRNRVGGYYYYYAYRERYGDYYGSSGEDGSDSDETLPKTGTARRSGLGPWQRLRDGLAARITPL